MGREYLVSNGIYLSWFWTLWDDSWRRLSWRPLKERTVLVLRDGEMSNSSGRGVTRDKNSSNFKIDSSRSGSGSGWQKKHEWELKGAVHVWGSRLQLKYYYITQDQSTKHFHWYYETNGIITTIICITYANVLWCSLFGHQCYYMSSTNPECHYHRSHYIDTLLDCDVCYEHRKKMKENWSKEGIKRKFVNSWAGPTRPRTEIIINNQTI